jgi:hypothetical protein
MNLTSSIGSSKLYRDREGDVGELTIALRSTQQIKAAEAAL